MNEIVDFMKELLLINEEKTTIVGLSSFKKPQKKALKKTSQKKNNKELRLSDLMRRA